MNRAFLRQLLLLLAFRVRLIAMLVGGLRMLLCTLGVFLALGMIALAMMFRRRAMRFRSIVVMFGCLIMFVTSHFTFLVVSSQPQPSYVPDNGSLARRDVRENVFGRSRQNRSKVGDNNRRVSYDQSHATDPARQSK